MSHLSASARPFDVVAMAASLGGVAALCGVLPTLPAEFPIPILIVQHLSPRYSSHLVEILAHRSALPVAWASTGMRLEGGQVVVAPPDMHMLVTPGHHLRLLHTPRVDFVRPSATALFTSVAQVYGPRALGVVLTGTGSDGARGVAALKAAGGRVLVQSQRTARAWGMPGAALQTGAVDLILALHAIAPALISLVMVPGVAQLFAHAQAHVPSVPTMPTRSAWPLVGK